jgi:hypothetical protein
VKWGIVPGDVRRDPLAPIKRVGLGVLRQGIGTVDPESAGGEVNKFSPRLHDDLKNAFSDILGLDSTAIIALVYPDPLPGKGTADCAARLRGGNEAMGQFMRSKSIKGFVFGMEDTEIQRIRTAFISPLRG